MKIRSGFVSNSSSSSFVLTEKSSTFNSPIEIAYHMLMERDWPSDGETLQKLTDMVRSGKITKGSNLSFKSTNYDTFIYYTGDGKLPIGIYTCNNIDWKFPGDIKYADEDAFGYPGTEGKCFTLIETGFCGIKLDESIIDEILKDIPNINNSFDLSYCKSCYTEMWLVKSTIKKSIICPICNYTTLIKKLNNPTNKWERV